MRRPRHGTDDVGLQTGIDGSGSRERDIAGSTSRGIAGLQVRISTIECRDGSSTAYPKNSGSRLPDPGSRVTRGRLGVSVQSITPELAEYFGAKNGGALVSSVMKESAAAKAGIRAGDVIVSINGKAVSDADELVDEIEGINGEATIVVLRDKKEMTLKATIERARPALRCWLAAGGLRGLTGYGLAGRLALPGRGLGFCELRTRRGSFVGGCRNRHRQGGQLCGNDRRRARPSSRRWADRASARPRGRPRRRWDCTSGRPRQRPWSASKD